MSGQRWTQARGLSASLLMAAALVGCGGSPLQGRYARGVAWIEFRADGTVQHGELGDTAGVEIDRDDPARITLLGGWGVPGQPAFLEFRSDGSFSWGKGIGGTYTMLGVSQVRLALVQDGKPVGPSTTTSRSTAAS